MPRAHQAVPRGKLLVQRGQRDTRRAPPAQHRPHYDAPQSNLVAMVHYTQGEGTGGTAFYRHRRTGFETITPDRVAAFDAAIGDDEADFGPLPASYYHDDSARYELIGEIEARPDRMIVYRGRQLHPGVIPNPPDRSSSPAKRTIDDQLLPDWRALVRPPVRADFGRASRARPTRRAPPTPPSAPAIPRPSPPR